MLHMEKSANVEEVRKVLKGVDVFAIRMVDTVTQVVCAKNADVARKITELLQENNVMVPRFLLMHPDGKTALVLHEDGSVTQDDFDKSGNLAATQFYPAPSFERLTKVETPEKTD